MVWALGLVRDPVVRYATPSGIELRSPYWRTQFDDAESMVWNTEGEASYPTHIILHRFDFLLMIIIMRLLPLMNWIRGLIMMLCLHLVPRYILI